MTQETKEERVRRIHEVAEFIEPIIGEEDVKENTDDFKRMAELIELANKCGHNYIHDLQDVWPILFKQRLSSELQYLKVFTDDEAKESDLRKKIIHKKLAFEGFKVKEGNHNLAWEYNNIQQFVVSSIGIGYRDSWRTEKSEYSFQEAQLITAWIWRRELSNFLRTRLKKGEAVATRFDKFMEISEPLFREVLTRAVRDKGDSDDAETIANIKLPRPVLYRDDKRIKVIDSLVVGHGSLSLDLGKETIESGLYLRDLSNALIEGTAPYIEAELPRVKAIVTARLKDKDALISNIKSTFAKELMMHNL